MKYFVYELIDPRNDQVFYIGKGCRSRPSHHLNETAETTKNMIKYNKIQSIRKSGFEPVINIVQRFDSENEAYDLEIDLIHKTPNLTNIQPGGQGGTGNISWKTDNPSSRSKGKTYEERYGIEKAQWMRDIRSSKLRNRVFSEVSILRMSESASKRDHSYKEKKVQTPLGVFSSMSEAAAQHGISASGMTHRVKSLKYLDYRYL